MAAQNGSLRPSQFVGRTRLARIEIIRHSCESGRQSSFRQVVGPQMAESSMLRNLLEERFKLVSAS